MSGIRQAPYGAFNFIVDLGTGSSEGPDAGFEECGPFAERVDVIEYRNGNDSDERAPQDHRSEHRPGHLIQAGRDRIADAV